ncbi:pseudouridine synthase [Flavitalea sp. BT771]|uniref:pseudouridine synthase n=1 Tax=Flavitalea sp. BT771 TaxID=3063329 RepID=UPI0026E36EAE|nr:pseudouridine synthase [Flavitalea sp. BT771]MDO6433193.1 pseudouridine synthase [Flavitalea sp. BT771]MDV6221531.1 pseudouridine synthase [Flavitalea sp. BT771]
MKRKTDNFSKFYTKKNNAAIKEAFRQEKKAAKKERKEAIERHFEEKRRAREEQIANAELAKKLPGKRKPPTSVLKATGPGAPSKPTSQSLAGPGAKAPAVQTPKGAAPQDPHALPLNKYIAHGGICSRRDAAELIRLGKVEVNGKLVTEPGTKVSPDDFVKVNGKKVTISRNFVYILLNKPKDYITTTDDPQGRKTVLDLIRQATTERVFPVGRLDRNTSGVLLLTNDGDLSQKLAHPKHEIKKIYHVSLDKPLTKADFDQIVTGVQLEDGLAHVDVLAYADPKDKTQVGLEIHSGRNRIVRRIFEHLGYDVRGLDRVMYAGLTKKNVQRGHWRLLTEKEIRILKYLNSSFRGSLSTSKSGAPSNSRPEDADDETKSFTPEPNKSKAAHTHTGTGYEKPRGGAAASASKSRGPKKPYGASAEGASYKKKFVPDAGNEAPFTRKPKSDAPFSRDRKPSPERSKAPFDRKAKSDAPFDRKSKAPFDRKAKSDAPFDRKAKAPFDRKAKSDAPFDRKPKSDAVRKAKPGAAASPRGRKSSGSYMKSKFTSRSQKPSAPRKPR